MCVVVRESDPASMEASIVRAREAGGVLEFRLDYLKPEDLSAANVGKWVELAQRPVVLTLRRRANGGGFDGSEEAQVRILKSLRGAFIDLEIETIESFLGGSLAPLKSTSSTWIASYHNFQETPADLATIYRRLKNSGADILKIATQAMSFEDNFRLLEQAQVAQRDGIPIIIAAMGELGTFSRLMATGRGSLWTYASLQKGRESAPGQFAASELKHLYSVDDINESTQVYGVIGWPIGHSLSPHIHNPALRQLGLNARYLPFSIQGPQGLCASLATIRWFQRHHPTQSANSGFRGCHRRNGQTNGSCQYPRQSRAEAVCLQHRCLRNASGAEEGFRSRGSQSNLAWNRRRRSGCSPCSEGKRVRSHGACQGCSKG